MNVENRTKVALVTGAGGGIGRAICRHLAEKGYRLALIDVSLSALEALSEELAPLGTETQPYQVDAGSEAQVSACIGRIASEWGGIDGVVNNAGISPKKSSGVKANVTEITLDEWELVMRINTTSVFLMCRAAIPHMLNRSNASIVNISSSAALDGGILAASHYAASKGAVSALTRTLAKEWANNGIRVNAIAPGRVQTPMATLSSPERNNAALARIPMGRFAEVGEIADAVGYMLSDQASYITGVTLNVSGGYVVA